MKKLALILFVSLIAYGTSQAQAIETGDQAVNLGLGFGSTMIVGDGLPSINFSYETLPFEKLGIGYISVGGFGAYKHSSYDYYGYDNQGVAHKYDVNYNYWVVAGRAAYHFDFYAMNHNDFFRYFDVYAGVVAGLRFTGNNYEGDYDVTLEDKTHFLNDLFAGCRYQFSDGLAVYAETSYNVSILSIGVSFLF